MYNALRCAALLFLMAPAVALAQHKAQPPCPPAVVLDLDLAEVAGLAKSVALAIPEHIDLAGLKELNLPGHEAILLSQQPGSAASFDAEKRKTFDKTYKVSRNDMLSIENKFGKVHVNTWNRNEVQVKVDIIARASSDQRAQDLLDKISIAENRSGSTISLKTEMEPMRVTGNNSQRGLEINYTISMPAESALTVKNRFGDVYLADFKGKADITVEHGSLKTGRLSNADNTVKLAYGSGNCGYITGGNIEVAYADMSVEGTNGLQGSSKFSEFRLGSLGQQLNMEVKYGSFRVENISKDVRKISLDGGFSPILLSFEDNTAFNFDVNVKFGDFKFDKSAVNITSLEKDHTSAEYKGKFGNASSNALVNITSKYGDVRFTR